MLLLSSCRGTLDLSGGQAGANILPTATPGVPKIVPPLPGDSPFGDPELTSTPEPTEFVPAPEQATSVAEPPPAPPIDVTPTINPVFGNVALPQPAELMERWRAQQVDRQVIEPAANFVSPSYQVVWWFDPVTGQHTQIGQLRGEFTVQATFRIKGQWIEALELPFGITEKNYGVTVPEAIRGRMAAAGANEWVEVYIYRTEDIRPK